MRRDRRAGDNGVAAHGGLPWELRVRGRGAHLDASRRLRR